MKLTGKQRRFLRSLGHHLQPTVIVGKAGLSKGLFGQLDAALNDHELVKLRFGRSFEGDRDDALAAIVERSAAALAGRVGRTALLYRPRPDDPEIRLPAAEG